MPTVSKRDCAPFWCLAPGASARFGSAARFAMGLDTVPSIPRALRGRDATEECRWIMNLELDGGKHVLGLGLAMTGEIALNW